MNSASESPCLAASAEDVTLDDVTITSQLNRRLSRSADSYSESHGLRVLASAIHEGSGNALRLLARLAIDLCGAGTGGVSLIEDSDDGSQCFRWRAIAGEAARFEGGSTPRNWSPCAACLETGTAALYSYPERYFTYLQALQAPIVEGLVVPMYLENSPIGTVWIVSHVEDWHFNLEDARVMHSLGEFVVNTLHSASQLEQQTRCSAVRQTESTAFVWKEYIRRIADGDHAAFTAFYDESNALVYATALRIVASTTDAEDIAAEVFYRVWTAASYFDAQKGGVTAWLVNITRSRAIDRLRRKRVRAKYEASCLTRRASLLPHREIHQTAHHQPLENALRMLPGHQRIAVELAYLNGLSATEIATRVGSPLGTIKTRLRIGLNKLRRILSQKCPD